MGDVASVVTNSNNTPLSLLPVDSGQSATPATSTTAFSALLTQSIGEQAPQPNQTAQPLLQTPVMGMPQPQTAVSTETQMAEVTAVVTPPATPALDETGLFSKKGLENSDTVNTDGQQSADGTETNEQLLLAMATMMPLPTIPQAVPPTPSSPMMGTEPPAVPATTPSIDGLSSQSAPMAGSLIPNGMPAMPSVADATPQVLAQPSNSPKDAPQTADAQTPAPAVSPMADTLTASPVFLNQVTADMAAASEANTVLPDAPLAKPQGEAPQVNASEHTETTETATTPVEQFTSPVAAARTSAPNGTPDVFTASRDVTGTAENAVKGMNSIEKNLPSRNLSAEPIIEKTAVSLPTAKATEPAEDTATSAPQSVEQMVASSTQAHPGPNATAATPVDSAVSSTPAPRVADPQQVMSQVISAARVTMRDNGNHEMMVRLDPPDLGTIHLKVAHVNGETIARIETASPMVRDMLDSRLAELRQSFADAGIRVDRCSVSLEMQMNQGDQQHFAQANGQQGWGNHSSASPYRQREAFGTGRQEIAEDIHTTPQRRIGVGSLDYLA